MLAARRAKSSPMPRNCASIIAITDAGSLIPARAKRAWISISSNSLSRSAAERVGVSVTPLR
jgi:hypothetical protein